MLKKLFSLQRYPEFVRLAWWRTIVPFFIKRQGVHLGMKVRFFGRPIISIAPGSRIAIGARSSLCSVSEFTALGVNHPVILRTLRSGAIIEIGADTGISGASICAATKVIIGSQCLFGANVVITDTDFHAVKAKNRRYNNQHDDIGVAAVYIGNNVFLGAGVVVLKGVNIGDNSVVGAGSVVAKNVPANSIAAGNPMKIIRRENGCDFREGN